MNKQKSYRTFMEFERQELMKRDTMYSAIDDIIDELFLQGLDAKPVRRRGGPHSGFGSEGLLFDEK
jgi:hypothetical protein